MTTSEARWIARALVDSMRDNGLDHLMQLACYLQDETPEDIEALGRELDHQTALAKVNRQAYIPAGTE